MSNKKDEKAEDSNPGSLASAAMMGGITGAGGFDFQARYIVCHLPEWLSSPEFKKLLHEGTGDVDLLFETGGKERRHHIQVKDHAVRPAELREIIAAFVVTDRGMPDVYQKFLLACPALSPELKPLENWLERYRGAKPFYDEGGSALAPTLADIMAKLGELQLTAHAEFILAKFHFQAGLSNFHEDGSCHDLFSGRILRHPKFQSQLQAAVAPAYPALIQLINAKRGSTLNSDDIEAAIHKALLLPGTALKEPDITISVHNWTKQTLEREPQRELDWSRFFDRDTRRVPSEEEWTTQLLPELRQVRKDLLITKARLIYFQGKAALTTGILFGMTFPQVGGWTIRLQQPRATEPWQSDAAILPEYKTEIQEEALDPEADSIALAFNITGKARQAVLDHFQQSGVQTKALLTVAPSGGPGSSAIQSSSEAVTLAERAHDALHEATNRLGVKRVHIFFYGPLGLAVFLGQRLTSIGEVVLYEFRDPGYAVSCRLRT